VAGAARIPAASEAFVESNRVRIPKVSRPPQLKDFLIRTNPMHANRKAVGLPGEKKSRARKTLAVRV
jgi:hypothetical protein